MTTQPESEQYPCVFCGTNRRWGYVDLNYGPVRVSLWSHR